MHAESGGRSRPLRPLQITLVPHTHWDREWYEPFDRFLERLLTMMDTLIELADRGFPHFHLDGQTALIDDYLAVRPERGEDVKRLVQGGRLSAGPWFTQMDEFLVSGESHIRNLERGLARGRELGRALEAGYLPDQFGHIGQMPQILQMSGINRAVVWRGVPNVVDRTAFSWEAPDGSRVTAEYLAFGYFLGEGITRMQTPSALAEGLREMAARVAPFLPSDRMLVMVGADHTGADATLPERLAEASASMPEIDVAIGSIAQHLEGEEPADIPALRGELRSSARAHLLPNVYSARIHQKRERAQVEALLERYAEPLAALVPGSEWPALELDRAWQLLLWNGAHDSVCGCSHDQVAHDVDARHAEARALCEGVIGRALEALGSSVREPGAIRFNPSPFERDGIPGLGWRVGSPSLSTDVSVDVRESAGSSITADGIELRFLDEPDVGDLYNYCYAAQEQIARTPARIRIEGQAVNLRFEDGLEVEVRISRRKDEPFIRILGLIRNDRPDHRLRLHVDTIWSAGRVQAGSPFEIVERPLVGEGGGLEAPSRTWPARGVVRAGATAVYHEGVFEYEVLGQELAITIMRCVGTISRERLATRPWPAGPDVPTPDAQMIGTTEFSLGVDVDVDTDEMQMDPRGLLADWERFALRILSAPAAGGGSLPASGSLLEVGGWAALSNIRRTGGAVEVRLWNPSDRGPTDAQVGGRTVTLGPAKIATVRLE